MNIIFEIIIAIYMITSILLNIIIYYYLIKLFNNLNTILVISEFIGLRAENPTL